MLRRVAIGILALALSACDGPKPPKTEVATTAPPLHEAAPPR
jgi:hypothetical protein